MSNLRKMFIGILILALLPIAILGYMVVFGLVVKPEQLGAAGMILMVLGLPGLIGTVES